jgi:hypothetical protein
LSLLQVNKWYIVCDHPLCDNSYELQKTDLPGFTKAPDGWVQVDDDTHYCQDCRAKIKKEGGK